MKVLVRAVALALCFVLAFAGSMSAEEIPPTEDGDAWVTFLLICNEGMLNDSGDVGNTVMVISMNPELGSIRQLMIGWDTFIEYQGFETPQLLDKPFRVGGPEETLKRFNENFNQNIQSYLSINFMNLASLIDSYGGVTVDVTRAERNALNGMVASKKQSALIALKSLMLDESLYAALFESYYLNEYGPETHLSGLQAVGFGWLQYDSVYNCCLREARVIADLFSQVGDYVEKRVAFYEEGETIPDCRDGRCAINVDAISESECESLYEMLSPIFDKSYTNLTQEQVEAITVSIIRAAYKAKHMDLDMLKMIERLILPLEHSEPYVTIAGIQGHTVDYEANTLAINRFLYNADDDQP